MSASRPGDARFTRRMRRQIERWIAPRAKDGIENLSNSGSNEFSRWFVLSQGPVKSDTVRLEEADVKKPQDQSLRQFGNKISDEPTGKLHWESVY